MVENSQFPLGRRHEAEADGGAEVARAVVEHELRVRARRLYGTARGLDL
jgi:hypothetical protein